MAFVRRIFTKSKSPAGASRTAKIAASVRRAPGVFSRNAWGKFRRRSRKVPLEATDAAPWAPVLSACVLGSMFPFSTMEFVDVAVAFPKWVALRLATGDLLVPEMAPRG